MKYNFFLYSIGISVSFCMQLICSMCTIVVHLFVIVFHRFHSRGSTYRRGTLFTVFPSLYIDFRLHPTLEGTQLGTDFSSMSIVFYQNIQYILHERRKVYLSGLLSNFFKDANKSNLPSPL